MSALSGEPGDFFNAFIGHNNNFNDKSDRVGTSVAIDDSLAIVGASEHDSPNFNTGGAYIIEFTDNGWREQAALNNITDVNLLEGDVFGSAVAISGNYAIVGAPQLEANPKGPGDAYIFERSGDTWELKAKDLLPFLKRENASAFGSAVAISGEYALVGASFAESFKPDKGIVYVFKRDPVLGWLLQEEQLLPLEVDRQIGAEFGASLSLLGNYALVGASGDSAGEVVGSGAAYFFELDPQTEIWGPPIRLTAAIAGEPNSGDAFGRSVAIGSG